MNISKELLTIIVAALIAGLIIGYGVWGNNQYENPETGLNVSCGEVISRIEENEEVIREMHRELQNAVAKLDSVEGLFPEIQSLKTMLNEDLGGKSDGEEQLRKEVKDLSRQVLSLRKKAVMQKRTPAERPRGTQGAAREASTSVNHATADNTGEKELKYLEFDYSAVNVSEENTKKIDSILRALEKKPDSKLEIAGYLDIEGEKEALRKSRLFEKIKLQKLNEMDKTGPESTTIHEVEIDPSEYEKYLRLAYKAESFSKPRNIFGFSKRLSVREIEELMLKFIEISSDDLQSIASQRTLSVRDYIVGSKKIAAERLLLVEPDIISSDNESMNNSVVVVKLR